MRLFRFSSALLTTLLASSAALACPVCASQDQGSSIGRAVALGGLLTLPFAVAGIIYKIIRSETQVATEPALASRRDGE